MAGSVDLVLVGLGVGLVTSPVTATCSLWETSLWQEGTLHVIESAPKGQDYQWRMKIAPPAEKGGEYFGMVLSWCGDQVFQHAALLQANA